MVIARPFDIISMLLEDPKLGSMGELGAFLMVASVDRISQRGSHDEGRAESRVTADVSSRKSQRKFTKDRLKKLVVGGISQKFLLKDISEYHDLDPI